MGSSPAVQVGKMQTCSIEERQFAVIREPRPNGNHGGELCASAHSLGRAWH